MCRHQVSLHDDFAWLEFTSMRLVEHLLNRHLSLSRLGQRWIKLLSKPFLLIFDLTISGDHLARLGDLGSEWRNTRAIRPVVVPVTLIGMHV